LFYNMVKIFVGGFPLDIEEIELAKLFALHGDINTIKIVRDKKTRICKGYAFIEMNDRAGAENAAEALNGTLLKGKTLTVNITDEPVVEAVTAEVKKKRPRRVI
jgi:RNA recognition motif-containing protein